MSCEHKIVTAPSDVAPVVFDLESESNALIGAELDWSPPKKRRNWSSSFLADGALETAAAWENRTITLTVRSRPGATTDQVIADMQTLHRIFLSGTYFLRHRPEGATKPVFFRLLPADVDALERYDLAYADREFTFTIPADPAAVGPAETFTAMVNNDPTDGGMRFFVSGVKGDLPTPLRLDCVSSLAGPLVNLSPVVVTAGTHPTFHHAAASWLSDLGWATDTNVSTVSDATAIGGSSSSSTSILRGSNLTFSSMLPGDYRLYVRLKAAAAGSYRVVMTRDTTELAYTVGAERSITLAASKWTWCDLGVWRLPLFSRQGSVWEPPAVAASTTTIRMYATNNLTGLQIDHTVALPAPGADGMDGRLFMASQPTTVSADRFIVAGADEQTWTYSASDVQASWTTQGGYPRLIPGALNMVTLLSGVSGDSKTSIVNATGSYYPRYLYLRGD